MDQWSGEVGGIFVVHQTIVKENDKFTLEFNKAFELGVSSEFIFDRHECLSFKYNH